MAMPVPPTRPARRALAIALALATLATGACRDRGEPHLFELLPASRTGIDFANTITADDSLNVQSDVYVYNGAGVAAGDVDGDGLPDLFFAGNMVSSRLYRNKGGMRFEDVTKQAGVGTTRWATGATMADVNGDGRLDIYVSVSGSPWSRAADRANQLFINDGGGKFTESAVRYGVADTGFTTHAAFLDYDGDGCLDLFLLENSPADFTRGNIAAQPAGMRGRTPGSQNQLYHNDCHGHFDNVSERAGIVRDAGYGLGVTVADFDRDGRPDIYVSNDAAPNDVLYVNNGDGTFTNRAGEWIRHASVAGMGVDAADVNDDGWPDIMQVDMMPRDLARRKRVIGDQTYATLQESHSRGLRDDYSANSLQMNNGPGPDGRISFSEVGRLAGVSHTEWSWSPLFADFDNDGHKDLFIGNGYPKAVNDLDYAYAAAQARQRERGRVPRAALDLLERLPTYAESSYFFRNTGDMTFADVSAAWGIAAPAFSYGAAYADLDNDGRLDLVVNNINGPAFVYHNVQPRDGAHHWLTVRLDGEGANRRGLGATVAVTAGAETQYVYQSPARGFMSTVDDRPHFGLGRAAVVDTLAVTWPDGRVQRLTSVRADTIVVVRQADAAPAPAAAPRPATPFQPMQPRGALDYRPPPSSQVDYSIQPLIPYMISRHGPALASGDVNGDGLDDLYVGGGNGAPGQLMLQRADGSFERAAGEPFAADSAFDDWGAAFVDANSDGRPDLYVSSGGYELGPGSPKLQDRLYVNQGGGRFARDTATLPEMLASKGVVRVGDYDGDGRPDLFVAGRLTPRSYPLPTRSWVLHNDGGRFSDVTAQVAPDLVEPGGMITDAQWVDWDGDGHLDLVTVGEWMPIRFHHNEGGRLRDVTSSMHLPPTRGWWSSLAVIDADGDGRPDLVAGNLGLNFTYTTSKDSLFGVYGGDFTGNGRTDVVLAQTIGGTDYSIGGLGSLGREIYTLGVKYPTHGAFAGATLAQLFGAQALAKAVHYQADTFASVVLRNGGAGRFTLAPLPAAAQIAPIRALVVRDVDGDGHPDLVVAGNRYEVDPNVPRADAGNGLWLRGDGRGGFTPVPPRESGFMAPHDASGLALLKTKTGVGIVVANAGDSLQAFVIGRR